VGPMFLTWKWLGRRSGPCSNNTTGLPGLGFSPPEMQEGLLQNAANAGALIRRGLVVTSIEPGEPARVEFHEFGKNQSLSARLVIAADGRNSAARKWAGFRSPTNQNRFYSRESH
jgi:2-polyprenyl-6-methoxyphenol hydroxylase-like FAD-dependent oxidoreductase